jgi:bacterial/archaeal transporter family-2 protein
MDRGAAVVLTAFVGGLIALQAPINSGLGRSVGSFQAAFVSFVIGTLALLIIAALAKGGLGRLSDIGTVPAWYYLTGGLLGAIYVTTVLVTVRSLGAGGVVAATVAGQLTLGMVVDQLGWLGVEKSPITALKLFGVLLLAAGTYLIVRE